MTDGGENPDRLSAPGAEADEASLDTAFRDAAIQVTEAGRAKWRARLAEPIPAGALARGRDMLRARGRVA
jgi:hypothetical protein